MKKNYQIPALKTLRVHSISPIATKSEGNITDDPAYEPALAPEADIEEDENPWEESVWEE